jgi:hypothetical protein
LAPSARATPTGRQRKPYTCTDMCYQKINLLILCVTYTS